MYNNFEKLPLVGHKVFHECNSSFVKMHFLGFNADNGKTLLSLLGRLQIDRNFFLGCNFPFIHPPITTMSYIHYPITLLIIPT
jgi:uncharacterized Zn-finger protein